MDRYNKYQTKQCTHTPHTLHIKHRVASTWLGDHQGRPPATAILNRFTAIDIMARYQPGNNKNKNNNNNKQL